MRRSFGLFLTLMFLASGAWAADSGARVFKVLPQYLDLQGQASISPSLYDRDAYQAVLQHHPEKRGGMQFMVQWKGPHSDALKLRVEARGTVEGKVVKSLILEKPVERHGWFSQWTALVPSAKDFKELGTLTAWRVTLWDGDTQLAEQKSFLW
jgi:hypothetical protein